MKKRVVKKHISRYIKPLIKHLPRQKYWDAEKEYGVTLVNGEIIPEGYAYEIEGHYMTAIKKQATAISEFLETHKEKRVSVRVEPQAIIADNQNWHMGPEHMRRFPRKRLYGIRIRFMVEK